METEREEMGGEGKSGGKWLAGSKPTNTWNCDRCTLCRIHFRKKRRTRRLNGRNETDRMVLLYGGGLSFSLSLSLSANTKSISGGGVAWSIGCFESKRSNTYRTRSLTFRFTNPENSKGKYETAVRLFIVQKRFVIKGLEILNALI